MAIRKFESIVSKKKRGRKTSTVVISSCNSIHPSFRRRISISPIRRGIGSLGNVLGNEYLFLDYIGSSDNEALKRDWIQIGNDIKVSISKVIK